MVKKRKADTNESNDEVTPPAKPRPRKKQGVTKTHSTAIKALIHKNATTSPLFLLPSEIRENILLHLIGKYLIHVKYLDGVELRRANLARNLHLVTAGYQDGEPPSYSAFADTIDLAPEYHHGDSDDDEGTENTACKAHEAWLTSLVAYSTAASAKQPSSQPGFRHAICVASHSEQSAYEEVISGNAIVPESELPEFYVASCEKRHANCKMCGSGPMFLREEDRQALRIDLNVLGVSRQLYEEANHLLWSTNIFSFEDPRTLKKFCASLNPAQKRNLSNIHISTEIGAYSGWNSSFNQRQRARGLDDTYWGTALTMSNLRMLRGVQTLHLCLDQHLMYIALPPHGEDSEGLQIEKAQQADLEYILRLRALAVKHVTVIVSDIAENLERRNSSAFRWTTIKKIKYAEDIRTQLVDPSGAELVKREVEAGALAKKTKVRDNAVARVKMFRSLLKAQKAYAARLAEWVTSEEAESALAIQKANRELKKSLRKGAKLQDAADKQEKKAEVARELTDRQFKKQVYLEEKLATAREQYKRAMARLGATPEEIQRHEEAEKLVDGYSDADMDMGEDDGAQAQDNIDSEVDESLVSGGEEGEVDEDDDFSS